MVLSFQMLQKRILLCFSMGDYLHDISHNLSHNLSQVGSKGEGRGLFQ